MIVSANLEKQASKIYLKISKIRKKGWFSKDISDLLIRKYANEKDVLLEQLKDNQKEINRLYNKNTEIAKKIKKTI